MDRHKIKPDSKAFHLVRLNIWAFILINVQEILIVN